MLVVLPFGDLRDPNLGQYFLCQPALPRACLQVPASVRVRREAAGSHGKPAVKKPSIAPGYGLAPQMNVASSVLRPPDSAPTSMDQKMMAFFQEVEELGAFDEM